ncbi:MAG: acyl-CoA synthetase [Gammaproteobacteria bacterium]|nr:acyl-CoA synthetase [Gammaproteobacteria bacterium]
MNFPHNRSYFVEQSQPFTAWLRQVEHCQQQFLRSDGHSFLLFDLDCYRFSVLFFGLIAANKRIVLPQNGQPQQLLQCMSHADYFVGSSECTELELFAIDPTQAASTSSPLVFNPATEIIFYTSGSSGSAKAIEKNFGQLITEVEQLEQTFGAMINDAIVMSTVSHQHIYGLLFKLLWPIWSGRDVYLNTFEYPEHLVHQVQRLAQRSLCLISSPAYYHRLVKDNVLVAVKDNIAVLISSGGPLDLSAALSLKQALNCAPIEVFGSTETGGIGWRQRSSEHCEAWRAFDDIAIAIDPLEQRLLIDSPYISQSGWMMTDDRVEIIDQQRFKLLGRADRIVKIEEKRCSLDEIQLRLSSHEWVEQAYVLALSGERHCLAAVVELSATGREAFAATVKFKFDREIKAYLKQYFEALVVPRKFRYLDALPFNRQGKLNKKELEQLFD